MEMTELIPIFLPEDSGMDVKLAERITYVYLTRIICAVGSIGNLLNLIVLARSRLKESPYVYLQALACADLIVTIIMIGVGFSRCGDCQPFDNHYEYFWRLYEVFVYLPFANIAGHVSVFLTVAVTIERYIFVKQPFNAKKFCNVRQARRVVIAILMVSLLLNLPRFFLYRIERKNEVIQRSPLLTITCHNPEHSSFDEHLVQGKCHYTSKNTNGSFHINREINLPPPTPNNIFNYNVSISDSRLIIHLEIINYTDAVQSIEEMKALLLTVLHQWENEPTHSFHPPHLFPSHQWLSDLDKDDISGNNLIPRINYPDLFPLSSYKRNYTSIEGKMFDYSNSNHTRGKVRYISSPTYFHDIIFLGYIGFLSFLQLVPLVLLSYFNYGLIKIVKHSTHRRLTLTNRDMLTRKAEQDQNRLTAMLIVVVICFLICNILTPFTSAPVAQGIFGDSYRSNWTFHLLVLISNLLVLINHSINFILYSLFNKKFWNEFKQMFCSPLQRPHRQKNSITSISTYKADDIVLLHCQNFPGQV